MTTNTDPVRALIGQWRDAAEFFTGDAGSDIRETLMACARELESALASAPPSVTVGVEWPIIVEGLRLADRFFDGDDRYWKPASTVRAAYLAALSAAERADGRTH